MYTTNDELSTIHFLNDQNIVQELSVAEEGKLNPIPSLSLLNKVNTDLGKRIDDGNDTVESISGTIALSVENLSGLLNKTIDEHSLSIGNLSGLLDATITSCDDISKRIDDLDADVSADNGEVVTSVKQKDGKIVSVGSAKITDDYVDKISEGKITGLSDDLKNLSAHYDNYVKKAGDSIAKLTVDNDLSVGKNVSFGKNFKVSEDGFIDTEFIKTEKNHGIFIAGPDGTTYCGISANIEDINIKLKDGAKNFLINDTSLPDHIQNAINKLGLDCVTLSSGEMIDWIKQENGTISLGKRPIKSTDIPTLQQDQISGLTSEYLKTKDFGDTLKANSGNFFKEENTKLSVSTVEGKKYIVLTNGSKDIAVNVDDLIITGIVESVTVEKSGGEKYPEKYGPYLAITQKKPDGTLSTSYTSIKDLIHVYESGEGIIVDGLTIKIDDDVVTTHKQFDPVETYVGTLQDDPSDPEKKGIIHRLSDDVQESFIQNIRNIKFDGCIRHYTEKTRIGAILSCNSEVGSEYTIRNNSFYKVRVEEPKSSLSTIFESSDGVRFTNSDYILVHRDDASVKRIPPVNLLSSDVTVIKAGVSKIDLDTEIFLRTAADTFLSNAIDTEVTTRTAEVGFLSNAIDTEVTTRTAADTFLSNAIDTEVTTRTAEVGFLSGAIDDEVTTRTAEVGFLSGAIDDEVTTRGEADTFLSNAIDHKVYIKNPTGDATLSEGAYSDLSVIKLPKEEYEQKVIDGTLNESCLYVVSSDYIDAYGEPLCNLTMPEGYEGVAVTKPYVDEKLGNVQTGVDTLLSSMWAELSVCYKEHNYQLSNYTCGDAISAVYNLTKIIGGYFKFVPPTVE